MRTYRFYFILVILAWLAPLGAALSEEEQPIHGPYRIDPDSYENTRSVTEIIVVLKPEFRTYIERHYEWNNGQTRNEIDEYPISQDIVTQLGKRAGIKLTLKPQVSSDDVRTVTDGMQMNSRDAHQLSQQTGIELIDIAQLLLLPEPMTPREARTIAIKVAKHPKVMYAEANVGGSLDTIPNDALYQANQWNLQQSAGGANLPGAWAIAAKLAKRSDLADVAPIDPEIGLVPPRIPHVVQ